MLGSPAPLVVGLLLLLLWFHTVWQAYVIEGTRLRLEGLQEIWRERLGLDLAPRSGPQLHSVQGFLDSSREHLPRLSLGVLLIAALRLNREVGTTGATIHRNLHGLPTRRLREDAMSIVETAARYVLLAALKRSLFAWAFAPLLPVVFILWSVYCHLRLVAAGAPQTSLHLARLRLRRKMVVPLVAVVTSSLSA